MSALSRIVNNVSNDVSSAFGHDATLVIRFKRSLGKEIARFGVGTKRAVEKWIYWKARYRGAAFRLRIAQRALAYAIANTAEPEIKIECGRVLRLSNAGNHTKTS